MKPISYDNYFWQNEKVRFRAWKEEDWETAFPSYFNSRARFFLEEEMELPPVEEAVREESRKYADFNPDSGRIMFAVESLEGETVGGINLNSIDERQGTFGIGIQIGVEHRGKGYGIAAMRLLMKYAFMERRLHKYNGGCVAGNEASEAMHRKLGCKEEGVRRQVFYSEGKYHDHLLFGLTGDEFIGQESAAGREG